MQGLPLGLGQTLIFYLFFKLFQLPVIHLFICMIQRNLPRISVHMCRYITLQIV